MREKAFEKPQLLLLEYAPDYFETLEVRDKAMRDDTSSLQFVQNWFITTVMWGRGLDMWYDKYHHDDGDYWFT